MLYDVAGDAHGDYERDIILPTCGRCFYCGMEIQKMAVFWRGMALTGDKIALHPACAQRLGAHLIKDGLIGERIDDGKHPLVGLNVVGA